MNMFTDKLYLDTKESHEMVDKHPFVSLIRRSGLAGELYINFNKVCIYELQKTLKLKDLDLQSRLHRDIKKESLNYEHKEHKEHKAMGDLLRHCGSFPFESAYQFYLGLLYGGGILRRMLKGHDSFLSYTDSFCLISDFKEYLNCNVLDESLFISRVNEGYRLIKILFDEFLLIMN